MLNKSLKRKPKWPRYSSSPALRKMRGEVTIAHLFTPPIGQILKAAIANVGEGVKQWGLLNTEDKNRQWHHHFWQQYGIVLSR